VLELGRQARLAQEPLGRAPVALQPSAEHLQRDDPAEGDVRGPVDHAHAALPHLVVDLVGRDHVAGVEPTGRARDATAPARRARGSDP